MKKRIEKNKRSKPKKETYLYYLKKFNELMEKDTPIYMKGEKEPLKLSEGEFFLQCYVPKYSNILFAKARSQMPRYWFVSNKGNLVSVKRNKPVWIKLQGDVRKEYRIASNETNGWEKDKPICNYDLVALVFGSYAFGKACEFLEKKGVWAIGKGKMMVNGHHLLGFANLETQEDVNDYTKIEFVTEYIHQLFQMVPDLNSDEKKYQVFMKELVKRVSEEVPNKAVIFFDGYGIQNGKIVNGLEQAIYEMPVGQPIIFANGHAEELFGAYSAVCELLKKHAEEHHLIFFPFEFNQYQMHVLIIPKE